MEQVDGGAPGLYPSPDVTRALVVDQEFVDAMTSAWWWASQHPMVGPHTSVRWHLEDESGSVPGALRGGSVGGAAAVALAHALGMVRAPIAGDAAVSATLQEGGQLGPVDELAAKLAGARGMRVVVSAQDRIEAQGAAPGDVRVVAARTVFEANGMVHRSFPTRALVALLVLVVLVLGLGVGRAEVARRDRQQRAATQERRAMATELAEQSISSLLDDPARSMLLAAAAWRADPTSSTASDAVRHAANLDERLVGFGHGHVGVVWDLVPVPGHDEIISGGEDGLVLRWGPTDGDGVASTVIGELPSPVRALAVSPDGSTIVAAGEAGDIGVWRPADATEVILDAPGEMLLSLAVSPDGSTLVSGDNGGNLRFWPLDSLLAGESVEPEVATGHSGAVVTLVFGPEGELYSGSFHQQDGEIRTLAAWQETPQRHVPSWLAPPDGNVGFLAGVGALAVTEEDLYVAGVELTVRPLAALDDQQRSTDVDGIANAVAVADDGSAFVATNLDPNPRAQGPPSAVETLVQHVDVDGGALEASFGRGMTGTAPAMAMRRDGAIFTGLMDGSVARWEPAPAVADWGAVTEVLPHPTEPGAAIVTTNDGTVRLVHAATRQIEVVLDASGPGLLLGADLTSDGRSIVTAHRTGAIAFFDLRSGEEMQDRLEIQGEAFRVELDQSERSLLAAGTEGTVTVFDLEGPSAPRQLPEAHADSVYRLLVRSDGTVVSGGFDGAVVVQPIEGAGDPVVGHVAPVGMIVEGEEGDLIVGDAAAEVNRMDAQSGELSSIGRWHTSNVLDGDFDPASGLMATASADQTVTVLDPDQPSDRLQVRTLDGTTIGNEEGEDEDFIAAAWNAAFVADGAYLVVGTADGRIQVVVLDEAAAVETICHLAGQGTLPETWDQDVEDPCP
jgi:WD40 repeat protein